MVEKAAKLWQLPYVNLFKHLKIDQQDWSKVDKSGHVSSKMDKTVKGTVCRIAGSVPAKCYLMLPKKGDQNLALCGRYLYLQFKPIAGKYFVFHVEVAADDDLVVRISISNLYKHLKCTSTWIQLPYKHPVALANAVDSVALNNARTLMATEHVSHCGPAPQNSKWTLLCLNLYDILNVYIRRHYSYLRNVQLCANMYVKNVFTSDSDYDPEISFQYSQKSGGLHKLCPIPREMAFPLSKGEKWHEFYCHVRVPSSDRPFHANSEVSGGSEKMLNRKKPVTKAMPIKPRNYSALPFQPISTEGSGDATAANSNHQQENKTIDGSVHVYPSLPNNEIKEMLPRPTTFIKGLETLPNTQLKAEKMNSHRYLPEVSTDILSKSSLKPDPVAELFKTVGSSVHRFKNAICWACKDEYMVYSSNAIVVALNIETHSQKFFIGHSDLVSCVSVNSDSTILASGQTGENGVLRIWKFSSCALITLTRCPCSDLTSLQFSSDSRYICAVGSDVYGKSVVVLWDSSYLPTTSPQINLLSKVHADIDISSFQLNPLDSTRMASCGNENIRLWRLKQNSLRSCPVVLGQYASQCFSDICFVKSSAVAKEKEKINPSIYCCSEAGFVLEVNSEDIAIRVVRKLVQTVHGDVDFRINSIAVVDHYCVSGSSDGMLRIWPRDFTSVLLEVDHDSAVILVKPSCKGDRILTVTQSNMVGVLDVATKEFITHSKCHKNIISSADAAMEKKWVVTASADMHVMVWDVINAKLLYNFHSESDIPLIVAFATPASQQMWIFCGFQSGAVRIFDISSAECVHEYVNVMQGFITGLLMRPCGKQFLVSDSSGTLASLASCEPFVVIRCLSCLISPRRESAHSFSSSLASSADGTRCAFIGPSEYIVSVVDTKTLDELLRLDVTQFNQDSLHKNAVIEKAALVSFSDQHLMVMTHQSNLYLLDAFSGKQLTAVLSVHKGQCTAMAADGNCEFIYTAGDAVFKVWDYKMQYDLNFQMFSGHFSAVNRIIPLPDGLVLSIGDNICIWRMKKYAPVAMVQSSKVDKHIVNNFKKMEIKESEWTRTESPQRIIPTPASLNISEIAVNPDAVISDSEDAEIAGLKFDTLTAEKSDVSCDKESHRSHNMLAVAKDLSIFSDNFKPPSCFRHFKRKKIDNAVASVHYSAPQNQAGLELKALIGFNGNGRDNIIWRTTPGILYYSCGIVIIVENLATSEQKILQGHVSEISTLTISTSDELLASASGSNENTACQIILWDLQTYTVQRIVSHHQHDIIALSFSSDSRFLLSLGDYTEQTFALWNVADMSLVTSTKLNFVANDVAWDCDSLNEFCIVGSNCSVQFWVFEEKMSMDTAGNRFFLSSHTCEVPRDVLRKTSSANVGHSFTCMAYSTGCSIVYIGSEQGFVCAWDTRSNKCFMHWVAATCEISYINAMGSRLITGSVDYKLKLWTVIPAASNQMSSQVSRQETTVGSSRLPGNGLIMEDEYTLTGCITGGSFDDNLELGIVATSDALIWYVNWLERNTVRLVNGHSDNINHVLLCGQDSIATLSSSGIRIYSCKEQELTVHFKTPSSACAVFYDTGLKSRNTSGNKFLAVGFCDGVVTFFDLKKLAVFKKINPHKEKVTHLAVAPENEFILSGSESGSAALIDANSLFISRLLSDHKSSPISDSSFSKFTRNDNRYFAIASQNRKISIWQINWTKDRCVLCDWVVIDGPQIGDSAAGPPTLVEFSTTEKDILLFTGFSFVQGINFYNMIQRKVVRQLDLNSYATFLTISPRGNLICTGTENWLIKLIDYHEGSFQDFLLHSGKVVKACFCHRNQLLVSCASNEVAIWEVKL